MIPDTVAALLALFGFVAPGLAFELRREGRRPAATESAFREASRVALTSVIFTAASLAVLVPLSTVWSALPDLSEWLRQGSAYVPDHYAAVALFVLLEVGVACGLALAVEALTARGLSGRLVAGGVWYAVFRRDVPPGTVRTWVWLTVEDGTQFKGPLRRYTAGDDTQVREIALGGSPILRLAPGKADPDGWEELTGFDAVVVAASKVRHMAVSYLAEDGTRLQASPQANLWQRARRTGATVVRRPG